MKLREYHAKRITRDSAYAKAVAEIAAVEALADEIVDGRVGLGWTQHELANRAKVTQAMVSRIERGLDNPTLETMTRLRSALSEGTGDRAEGLQKSKPLIVKITAYLSPSVIPTFSVAIETRSASGSATAGDDMRVTGSFACSVA